VVSHDRWFLDRTVDRLFCFEDGLLRRFEGNYSAYLESRSSSAAAAPKRPPGPAPGSTTPGSTTGRGSGAGASAPPAARRRSFKEGRELAAIERDLPLWEERRSQLEQQLAAPGCPYGEIEALTNELAELLERIAAAEDRWLVLSELMA